MRLSFLVVLTNLELVNGWGNVGFCVLKLGFLLVILIQFNDLKTFHRRTHLLLTPASIVIIVGHLGTFNSGIDFHLFIYKAYHAVNYLF